jgi:hypothetical protein
MAREKYKVTIIKVTEDSHSLRTVRTNSIPFRVRDSYKEVEIENDKETVVVWDTEIQYGTKDLYEVKNNFIIGFLAWIFRGIAREYIIVTDKKGEPIKEETPEISGKVLKVSKDWKGLDKAIRSAFQDGFNIPRVGFVVIIVIAVIALFLLIRSGYIPTPEGFPI